MKRFILFFTLLASAALAQDITRGGALKRRAYQTYSTVTLYVDPTGSDTNACTASGTSACATPDGALAKLPRFLRHNVTINVAAGTYTTLTISDLIIAPTVTLTIAGSLANITPATGSATGTTTSVTAGSASAGPQSITDSGQSWTSSDLHGYLLTLTSGGSSGLSYPIDTNTTTALTIPLTTSVGVGVTYAIQSPSATFTSTATIYGVTGGGSVALTALAWTGAGRIIQDYGTTVGTTCTNCTLRTTSGGAAATIFSGYFTFQRSFGTSSAGHGLLASYTVTRPASYGTIRSANSLLETTSSTAGAQTALEPSFMNSGLTPFANTSILRATGSGTFYSVLNLPGGWGSSPVASSWVYCTNAAGIGIASGISGASSTGPSFNYYSSTLTNRVEGCGTGLRLQNRQTYHVGAWVFDTCTTGISVSVGGVVNFEGRTPTFSTVTNELQVDSENFTFATLNGLASPQVITSIYGSSLIR